ncbi:winged helix-turn-helix transcriptional regulator [Glycomyces sp. TRM65418]|uniref:GbsR/MarR family transcriptional regulator n=1 Tax=Glycomyces sp. TRM65418 TaxID=2867006 RepID=UPI001CE69AFD|nr:MarR family transcriptional regulator [Glycomyces sp. TRM65418]MCC3765696.1 winged helix-turn-helix transcriptional regulator [Glycomyces sp. TRM65418]QZD55290.1 winged helix-turn-helix transcriptional regulator [Glycomyces sp. TRM65418]
MDHRSDERKALLEYVEQFTEVMVTSGMQRMSARVFSYVLVDDAETYTAAEIAEGLGISLAAVSGAVRELIAAGLLIKGRRPSTRADIYKLNDEDIWGSIMLDRTGILNRYQDTAVTGIETLPDGPGRDRLIQTAAFMEFMKAEMGALRVKWNERRKELCTGFEEQRRSAPPR